jgi:hypothetical protein
VALVIKSAVSSAVVKRTEPESRIAVPKPFMLDKKLSEAVGKVSMVDVRRCANKSTSLSSWFIRNYDTSEVTSRQQLERCCVCSRVWRLTPRLLH